MMGNRFMGSSLAGSIFAAVAVLALSPVLLAQTAPQLRAVQAQSAASDARTLAPVSSFIWVNPPTWSICA